MMRKLLFLCFIVAIFLPITVFAQDNLPPVKELAESKTNGLKPYYIQFPPNISKLNIVATVSKVKTNGGELTHSFDNINAISVNLTDEALEALKKDSNVLMIEPVPVHHLMETLPAYHYQATGREPQTVPWNIDQFQARDIWDVNRDGVVDPGAPDGSGVRFCIIDTGFYAAHDDFQGITVSGYSQISGENWYEDGHGHGTHVAGTANAVNNSIGVVGVMPGGAELFIVKIFDNTGVWVNGQSNLGAAAQVCRDAGANVISMSLGGDYSATEEAIFQDLYDNYGIVNVAAAGNDGNNVASYPASYDSVISVAAIDENETVADFSQYPPTSYDPLNPPANVEWDVVELSGGGVAVLSTLPGPPHGDLPFYQVTVNSIIYSGIAIEETPNGTASAALVDGGLCDATNPAWNGLVVLCERGDIAFSAKINNVGNSGGVAALIYNNEPGNFAGTCGGGCTVSIPALSLSQEDGQYLQTNELGSIADVVSDDGSGCTDCAGAYGYMSGTSMATPGVAAGVAFTWDACGGPTGITNQQLRQLLRDTAKDLTGTHPGGGFTYGAGWDVATGWGLIQLRDALDEGNNRFGSTCPLILLVDPPSREICTLTETSTTFEATLNDTFVGTTDLTLGGAPAGSTYGFSPNPVISPATVSTLTLSNLDTALSGSYTLAITATDSTDPTNTSSGSPALNLSHALPGNVLLTSPLDGAVDVSVNPTFGWSAANDALTYEIQVATDPLFNNIVHAASGLTSPTHSVWGLEYRTNYFWRVRALNACGVGEYSPIFAFQTDQAAGCSNVLLEPGFEGGPNSAWSESSAQGWTIVDPYYPRTGTYGAWLGGDRNENAQIWQSVPIDPIATSATLSYWYVIGSTDSCGNDYGYVRVDGNAEVTYDLCTSTATGGYIQSTNVNMDSFIGDTPEIRFQVTTNGGNDHSNLFVDDVSLEVCVPELIADYSDLSGSYGVAWHEGGGALQLGPTWTADTGFSDGADNASDDGVDRLESWVSDLQTSVQVTVNGSGNPWLAAWVDWNNDGVFTDPGENIIDQALLVGANTIDISIPVEYETGTQVQARFRLYDVGELTINGPISSALPTGGASNGEVEDFTWSFTPTAIQLTTYQGESRLPQLLWVPVTIGILLLVGFVVAIWKNFAFRKNEP